MTRCRRAPARAAVADAGSSQTVQFGTAALLDGSNSSDEITPLADLGWHWVVKSAPAGGSAAITDSDTANPSVVPDRAGDYTLELTVTDPGGLQDTDETTVTFTPGMVDGSFENDFTGWATSGNVAIQSGAPYAPTDGTKLAAFNSGNSAPDGVLSQTIPTIPGQAYRLEFDVGVLAYNSSNQSLGLAVQGGSPLISDTITLVGPGGGKTLWVAKSYQFTADSATTTLTFRDLSLVTASIDLLLDHARVTPLSPPCS